jgi:Zn-dependent peptidase ImmA (M78 family)/transcriptional regulator with XRE-family HTH domain
MAPKTAAAVGAAIKRARVRKGLSQGELAALLGKTQSAISFWEKGRRAPDLHDLVDLIGHLDLDLDELFAEAGSREPAKVLLRAEAHRLLPEQLAEDLYSFIERAEAEPAPPVELRIANDSPIGAAQELLSKAGVTKPPVPVEEVAARCGVRVLPIGFQEGLSGVLVELERGAVIGHADDYEPRRRFSIAHELGHHLLRHYDNFHIDPEQTATEGHPPGYDWRDERAANEFAAQLLMPATWVSQRFKRTRDVARLAEQFDVSPASMRYRLITLGLR